MFVHTLTKFFNSLSFPFSNFLRKMLPFIVSTLFFLVEFFSQVGLNYLFILSFKTSHVSKSKYFSCCLINFLDERRIKIKINWLNVKITSKRLITFLRTNQQQKKSFFSPTNFFFVFWFHNEVHEVEKCFEKIEEEKIITRSGANVNRKEKLVKYFKRSS